MAKGAVTLVGMLFLATALVVVVAGIILVFVNGDGSTVGANVWAGVMHVIDAGTITGAGTDNIGFLVVMSLVTLCGLFVTSILIGIITTGFEEKLYDLKKGTSRVIEENHTVILGFNNNIYSLISETIEANENHKDGCIVILADDDKEMIDTAIAEMITDLKTTRIITRKGNITDFFMLTKCSIEKARCIIINEDRDLITIKSILGINNYLNRHKGQGEKPHIVATIYDESNYHAAKIISEGNAEIVLVQDAISRIIAQTCRYPGLSDVLIELFDYDGDELYFETFPELKGEMFGDVLNYFKKAVVFGYKRDGQVVLNPQKDVILKETDELLLLVEDDGMAKVEKCQIPIQVDVKAEGKLQEEVLDLLIVGANAKVEQIVLEVDEFMGSGSRVTVANAFIPDSITELAGKLRNVILTCENCDVNDRDNLERLTHAEMNHVLLLSDDCDSETSDAMTLLRLIHLRDIAKINSWTFSITSEMKDVANQRLAKVAEANDLVVGSNIINLMLTQIAENRSLSDVFQELLRAEGSEIYIRDASYYVKLDTEMDFYTITDVLKEHNEIAIGYKKQNGKKFEIITNPEKSTKVKFGEQDGIISLAMD